MNWRAARSAIGKGANLVAEALIGILEVDRHRIVNATGDTHFRKLLDDFIPSVDANCIDVIDVPSIRGRERRDDFLHPS